jgi:hypothetical protein
MDCSLTQTITAAETDQRRRCPHCNTKLTFKQIIILMHGSGYEEYVPIRTANGRVAVVEVGLINPTQVEILDGGSQ